MRYLLSLLFALLCLVQLGVAMRARCAQTCRFTLCRPSVVSLGLPFDKAQTSAICLKGRRVGIVNSGEALVRTADDTFTRISLVRPVGLKQAYAPHFFKTFNVRGGSSGVGHETPQQNQAFFLNGRCVALPVQEYQVIRTVGKKTVVVKNVHLSRKKPLRNCVSFRVRSARNGGIKGTKPPSTGATVPTTTMPWTTTTMSKPSTTKPTKTTTAPSTTATKKPTTTSPSTTTTKKPTATTPSTTTTKKPTTTAPESTTTTLAEVTKPEVVDVDGIIKLPTTTKVGEKRLFKFKVTVRASSGATKEDFYLLSDATSSMTTAINTAKAKFLDLVKARQAASSDVAFGVGYYKDERESDLFVNVQSITKEIGQVEAGINSLEAGSIGNPDTAEGALVALYRVATLGSIGWRPDSRRLLVMFGDAPGHEPSCGFGPRLTRTNVIAELKKKGITVVATSFMGGTFSPGLDAETTPFTCTDAGSKTLDKQVTAITSATGGKIVEAEDQEMLIDSILKSVGGLAQDLDADASDCEAQGVSVTFEPNFPLTVGAGKTVTVTETVKVGPGVCGLSGSGFSCNVKFTLSGAPIGEQTLQAPTISGC